MHTVAIKKRPTIFICLPEDKKSLALAEYLTRKHYVVTQIPESSRAIDQIVSQVPDLVLVDALFPAAGGYEVCGMVRPYYDGHILLIGEARDDASQLLAFERGADDYILKPVSPALLSARIQAHLKRTRGPGGKNARRQISVGVLTVDATRREVLLAGRPIELTTMQFELLWYLIKRSGRVVSRQELYEALYQAQYNGFDRSVDVYISRIRQQLGEDAEKPTYLKTIRGVGYLFVGHDGRAG